MQPLQWNDSVKMGKITLKNRIVMSALTRQRCQEDGSPNDLNAFYYSQRTGAAMIFTETTAWCQRGKTSLGSPGIYNQQHVAGWKKVTGAVHDKNGLIFVQLNHAGRATNSVKTGGLQTWAPSAIQCRQKVRYLQGNLSPIPKQMTKQDIKTTLQQFRHSVQLIKQAGFDGIQLQGAHGYLIDQFLRTATNKRNDQYGGSVENRCRYCLELFSIALQYFEPYQLGIKLSPVSRAKDMFDQNPTQTYGYLLSQLSKLGIGFAEVRQSTEPYNFTNHYGVSSAQQVQNVCGALRKHFTGILIGNDSFNGESGLNKINSGDCDMISFGQLYIGNPDLAQRIIGKVPVNVKLDKATFYGMQHGEKGYIDYPFSHL